MSKRFALIFLCALMLALPALADMESGETAQLVVCGELVPLDATTGFICRDGKRVYIPLEIVAASLGYEVEKNSDGTALSIKTDAGTVTAASGHKDIRVDGAKKKLNYKAVMFKGRLMTDYRILEYMGADVAVYKMTEELALLGYTGPTMVVSRDGETVLPPALTGDSFAASLEAAKTADQIVAVKQTEGSKAILSYHEKVDGVWRQVLSCEAVIGENGIGKTVEDDRKTPRGTYDLKQAFGILPNPGTELAYTELTKNDYWVRNWESDYYNQLISTKDVDYTPADVDIQLRSAKGFYDYAVVIDYNADCTPGKGSAIFLHCTGDSDKDSTSGSIAIPEKVLKQLLTSLKPGAKIVIF